MAGDNPNSIRARFALMERIREVAAANAELRSALASAALEQGELDRLNDDHKRLVALMVEEDAANVSDPKDPQPLKTAAPEDCPLPVFGEPDLPLFVEVALALGWWGLRCDGRLLLSLPDRTEQGWRGWPPNQPAILGHQPQVPKFSTDWTATGPLIEKYRIGLIVQRFSVFKSLGDEPSVAQGFNWVAHVSHSNSGSSAATPLVAVCNLILAMKKDGKL